MKKITITDLKQISAFKKIIMNYLKMTKILTQNGKTKSSKPE